MDRTRFEALLPLAKIKDERVMVVGCGGIGSWTALVLAKMGFDKFTLVDFDQIEEANVATQVFTREKVGDAKVDTLGIMIEDVSETAVVHVQRERFHPDQIDKFKPTIVLAVTDNMESRREVWRSVISRSPEGTLYVDGRTGAEALDVYCVRKGGDLAGRYSTWITEEGYMEEKCGARAIAYTGAFAASVIAKCVARAVMEPKWEGWVCGDMGALALKVMEETKEEVAKGDESK